MIWLLGWALAQSPDIDAAIERQQDLPQLLARESSAQARVLDAQGFFDGTRSLEEAWPHFAGAPLNDPAWVAGQLARLDTVGAARATERLNGGPDELADTLAVEAQADAYEREVLHRLQGLLTAHPQLTSSALRPWLAHLQAERAAAVAAWEGDADLALGVAEADERIAAVQGTVRAAIDHATHGEPLSAPVIDDLYSLRCAELLATLIAVDLASWDQPLPDVTSAEQGLATLAWLAPWQQTAHPDLTEWLRVQSERVQADVERLELDAQESLVDTTLEEAEQRRVEAEQALAEAQDDEERTRLNLLRQLAEQQELAASYVGEVDDRREALEASRTAESESLEALIAAAQQVHELPRSIGGERDEEASKVYVALSQAVDNLRRLVEQAETDQNDAIADAVDRKAQAAATRNTLGGELKAHQLDGSVPELDKALRAVELTADRAVEDEKSHRADLLQLLKDAKLARRALRTDVPNAVVRQDDVIGEATYELSLAADTLWSLGRDRVEAALGLPAKLTDLSAIRTFLSAAFWVIIGLLAWRFARPRAVMPVRFLIQRAAEQRPKAYRRELTALEGPAEPVVVALVDGLAVILLVGPALRVVPEVGLLLLVWLQVAAYRLIIGLYDLLVSREGRRLALMVLPADAWELGRKTLQWVLLWAIVRQFLGRTLLELLVADALHQLLVAAFSLILFVLTLRLLHEWEPILRRRIAQEGTDNAVRAYLAKVPKRPLLTRWYRAMVGFVLLGVAWTWRFVQGQAREGSTLARALNMVYRYSLSTPDSDADPHTKMQPLPEELVRNYLAPADQEGFVQRTGMDERFWGAVRRWEKEHRHGTVAFIADRGAGRTTWLNRACRELAGEGRMVTRFPLNERCLTEASLCAALGEHLGAEGVDSVDALTAVLDARPGGFILVEDAHRSFLRTVGGLDGLRALFEVLGRTSDRHFWVVTFHLPAWHYLSRLGGLLKVHIFQHILELPAMPEGELRQLLNGRTERAGYTVDYSNLVRRGALSGDQADELERATVAFYRVLGEASYGNPSTAVQLWKDCVRADPSSKRLEVSMGAALSESRLTGLTEQDLFTLAAVRMQDGLTEREIVQVNNMSPGVVRSSLQVLRGRGLLVREGENFHVPSRQQATVTRTLQHANYLDWRA